MVRLTPCHPNTLPSTLGLALVSFVPADRPHSQKRIHRHSVCTMNQQLKALRVWLADSSDDDEADGGGMTVEELIEKLATYPPGMTVVLSKDAEGNHFSQLAEVTAEAWEPESTYSVIVYNGEDDDIEDLVKGPVLWPVN